MTVAEHPALAVVRGAGGALRTGRLTRIMPTSLEADGPSVAVGTLCAVGASGRSGDVLLAEVISLGQRSVRLVPHGDVSSLAVGARVVALSGDPKLPVGDAFLGRAVDCAGKPIDGGGSIRSREFSAINPDPPTPLERSTPDRILKTGIRAIDGLLTLGEGQRIGIFSASGVGKTSLLSQLVRQVEADVCITCLVGERGREVESFWSGELGGTTRARSVLIAATSDQPAALRIRAVHQAVALARHFRDQGKHVFFVLDSVTRFAMALRELGLAAGEPPTIRAYTPSVFAIIPRMVEQFGALRTGGSISAVMTVLSETDDTDDPLSELMKSLLDGHLILSRTLAERGHFPAIDPLKSVSRNAPSLRSRDHRELGGAGLALLARYESARPLIESGLYVAGSNRGIDAAIAAEPPLTAFLRQELANSTTLDETIATLRRATRESA